VSWVRSVVLAVAAVALVACGHNQGVRGASRDNAIVYVKANVKDAGVWVDGIFIGGLESLRGGIAIEAGTHRIEVRHDDYFAYYDEVAVKAGEKRKLDIDLAPVLP
jgi:hypothetical protein